MKIAALEAGEQITKPGIYSGVSMDKYHGGGLCDHVSISSSGLRRIFNDSAAHYWATSPYNDNRIQEDPSEAMILGRAAHHLLLGEQHFSREFIIRPEEIDGERWNGNRKSCRAWLATQQAKGLTVLKGEHVEAVRGMSVALSAHPLVHAGVLSGLIEHTIVTQDKATGIYIKARPDAIPNDSADFADLKTTMSVSDSAIQRTLDDYAYHVQAAVVGMACRDVLKIEMNTFSLVFVEKKVPHCVRVVTLRPEDIQKGEAQARVALKMFAKCLQTDEWPGPGGTQMDAAYIGLPPWAPARIDNRIAQLEQELAA